jgi:Flp pilus assembly pilin Flp
MLLRLLNDLWHDEQGQDLVEWTLLLAFITLVAVGVLSSMQSSYIPLWRAIAAGVGQAVAALH